MKRKRNPERADRENPLWTKETFSRARQAREVLPEIFGKQAAAKMLKARGRSKTGNARTSISLRLPPDTLARWKATGPGWQTRMAETLRRPFENLAAVQIEWSLVDPELPVVSDRFRVPKSRPLDVPPSSGRHIPSG
jgi:uncharacterized protein (DUF4415 family)